MNNTEKAIKTEKMKQNDPTKQLTQAGKANITQDDKEFAKQLKRMVDNRLDRTNVKFKVTGRKKLHTKESYS